MMRGLLIFCCLLFPVCANADITTGLVGWWKLDEGSGTTTGDSSRSGFPGTFSGTPPTWASNCARNNCLTFTGTQYVNMGGSFNVVDSHDKTIAAWINPTACGNSSIIDKDGDGTTGWGLWFSGSCHLWWWAQGGLDLFDSGAAVNLNQWSHVAAVWHYGTDTVEFYLNGVLNSTQSNGSITEGSSGGINLLIGAYRNGGGFYYSGQIDDVRVYNRCLKASEIRALFIGGNKITQGKINHLQIKN